MRKAILVAALAVVACGKDVELGGDGGGGSSAAPAGGSVVGHHPCDEYGCPAGFKCCIAPLDVNACTTELECLATDECPAVPCEPQGGNGGADAGVLMIDGGNDTPDAGGGGSVGCGPEQCVSGQDCCIVTIDAKTCTSGLQCVWGGCPPAPCDPHGE